jgi:hypothetical protein
MNLPDRQPISGVVGGPDGQLVIVGQSGVELIKQPGGASSEQMENAQ